MVILGDKEFCQIFPLIRDAMVEQKFGNCGELPPLLHCIKWKDLQRWKDPEDILVVEVTNAGNCALGR